MGLLYGTPNMLGLLYNNMTHKLGDIISAEMFGRINDGYTTPAYGLKCCRTIKVEVTGTYYPKPPKYPNGSYDYTYIFDTKVTKDCDCQFDDCPPNIPHKFRDGGNMDPNPDGTSTPMTGGQRNFTYSNQWSDEQGPCGLNSSCKCGPSWVDDDEMGGITSVVDGRGFPGDDASHADSIHKSIQDDIEDLMERYDPTNPRLRDWECCRK